MEPRPTTLVLGASTNPDRYSYKAAMMLTEYGHPIKLVGLRPDSLLGQKISTENYAYPNIDTITVYVGERNHKAWLETILGSNPRRIILNPGAEGTELSRLAQEAGIEVIEACTLVMLRIGQYE